MRGFSYGLGRASTDDAEQDVREYTVVAGNPAKLIRRIEPGPNAERHHNLDIQEQNDRMLAEMLEDAKRGHDR